MRGEASALFGGLIGTIAHYLVLFGVAPAVGYQADPFVALAGDLNVFWTLVTYILVLAMGAPLGYHYAREYVFEPGLAVGTVLVAAPVWVGFVLFDCLNAQSFLLCAATSGLAAALYGFFVAFSYDQFTGTL